MKRIIAVVDLSEPSLRAVDLSADLANKYDAELVLPTVGHDITRTRSWDGGLRSSRHGYSSDRRRSIRSSSASGSKSSGPSWWNSMT
jgi:nucleotide-binding universal stress UspA family protein